MSIDAAQSENARSSFSVIQAWQQLPGGSFHLFQQFRAQCGFAELQDVARSMVKQFQPRFVLIETASNGAALLSVLERQLPHIKFKPVQPQDNKAARLERHGKFIRKRKLSLQRSTDWLVDFLVEFTEFPNRGTDIVDATTQFLDFAKENPVWPAAPANPRAAIAGVGSDGRPLTPLGQTESGPRGIAIARGFPFFRR